MALQHQSAGDGVASGSAAQTVPASKPRATRRGGLRSASGRAQQTSPYRDAFEAMSASELATLEAARHVLRSHLLSVQEPAVNTPQLAAELAALHLRGRSREVFAVIFLDSQLRFLAFEELFLGTINSTTVHPREVLRRALAHNAGAVILAHNHPSGLAEPSGADLALTEELRCALRFIDVDLVDHLVVGLEQVVSFRERRLLTGGRHA